jgi:hypothetical protein
MRASESQPLRETRAQMSHPDPNGPADRTPIDIGEVWDNPVSGERATILERPWDNPAGRATAELTALVGARVVGEHRHPTLVEKFTVLEGELTVKCNGQTSILPTLSPPKSSVGTRYQRQHRGRLLLPRRGLLWCQQGSSGSL